MVDLIELLLRFITWMPVELVLSLSIVSLIYIIKTLKRGKYNYEWYIEIPIIWTFFSCIINIIIYLVAVGRLIVEPEKMSKAIDLVIIPNVISFTTFPELNEYMLIVHIAILVFASFIYFISDIS